MDQQLKDNLSAGSTWLRGLYMLLFAVLYSIAEIVLTIVVLFQFGNKLISGQTNERLLGLGQNLATYIYQVLLFLTFKTEQRPYPFGAWPKGAPAESAKGAPKKKSKRPTAGKSSVEKEKAGGESAAEEAAREAE